jgi:hypothetical protein
MHRVCFFSTLQKALKQSQPYFAWSRIRMLTFVSLPLILVPILCSVLPVFVVPCWAQDSLNVCKTGEIYHDNWTIQDVVVEGENAYFTCWDHGIRIADISNPYAIYERPAGSPPC